MRSRGSYLQSSHPERGVSDRIQGVFGIVYTYKEVGTGSAEGVARKVDEARLWDVGSTSARITSRINPSGLTGL
jgi:hypothetical protein